MKNLSIKCRIVDRINNALLMVALIIAMSIYVAVAEAQSSRGNHVGLEGTYGVRSFTIKSDIPELNNLSVLEEGGSVGFVMGTPFIRLNTRAIGLYYSAARTSRTIDMFEIETTVNFYPLQLLKKYSLPVNFFITGGLTMDKIKFFGHYLAEDESNINYSNIREPYLGSISQINATGGLGVEYRVPNVNFVTLFSEVRFGLPIQTVTKGGHFENTTIQDYTAVCVGVSFGKGF
jgi:hypothetical protein